MRPCGHATEPRRACHRILRLASAGYYDTDGVERLGAKLRSERLLRRRGWLSHGACPSQHTDAGMHAGVLHRSQQSRPGPFRGFPLPSRIPDATFQHRVRGHSRENALGARTFAAPVGLSVHRPARTPGFAARVLPPAQSLNGGPIVWSRVPRFCGSCKRLCVRLQKHTAGVESEPAEGARSPEHCMCDAALGVRDAL